MSVLASNLQYVAVGFGGLFLVPQIVHGYTTGSLRDLSSITLIFITVSSSLWSYYMYRMTYTLYVYIAGFVCVNALLLLLMQISNYYKRFKLHVNTFETKTAPVPCELAPPIVLQMQPHPVIPELHCDEVKVEVPV